ncbi:MAG: proline racemase family protein [Nakamurella sp.]
MMNADGGIVTTDYHTAGEPFRIVTAGGPDLPGSTVADRRVRAIESAQAQRIRELLCHEPRGHADMYGCFVVPPDDPGAALGVLFWHKDGFSTACGHGTIALATWAAETGVATVADDGSTDIQIDVPSGRVTAIVRCVGGAVLDVTFRNVPSFVLHRRVGVETSRGNLAVDVSFGGAIYASLPAQSLGLAVSPDAISDLTAMGREIKWAVQNAGLAEHPSDSRLSGCYGTMIYDDFGDAEPEGVGPPGPYQRSITVFADGEVDRSPCGSGTSARMALLHADGRLGPGMVFTHDSIIGTRFVARIPNVVTEEGRESVITEVTGRAYRTGEHRFYVDPRDDLGTGFVLR